MALRLSVRHSRSAQGQADVSYELEQGRVVIGRSPGADVRLPHLTVSETHATLEQTPGGCTLRDESSTNGTLVNGVQLVALRPRALSQGDQIEIGEFVLTFEGMVPLSQPVSPERTASLARRMLREMLGREHAAASPPFVKVLEGPDRDTTRTLGEPPERLRIGRGDEADLVLTDPDVSRLHVELVRDVDGTLARDLDSKNGLSVNGKRLRERRLRHGDMLKLGATTLQYQDPAEEALRGLEGKRDVTITRTQPMTAPEAERRGPPSEGALHRPAPPVRSEAAGSDVLVYAFALIVLIASVLGLVWLFTS